MTAFLNFLLLVVQTIALWPLTGLRRLCDTITPALQRYIDILKEICIQGIGAPIVVAAVAYLGYGLSTVGADVLRFGVKTIADLGWNGGFWFTVTFCASMTAILLNWIGGLWSWLIALAGVISFLYAWLCGTLASPIGVVVNAANPTPHTKSTEPEKISWSTFPSYLLTEIRDARIGITEALRKGVESYTSQVRFALIFIGCTYFFAAAFPSLRGITPLLILGALVLTALRPSKSAAGWFVRIAVITAMTGLVLVRMFPVLSPFSKPVAQIDRTDVGTGIKGMWNSTNAFILGEHTTPAFWILAVVVGLFALKLLTKSFKGSGASELKVSGKGLIVALVLAVLAFLVYNRVIAHSNAAITADVDAHKQAVALAAMVEELKKATNALAAIRPPAAPTARTRDEIWRGLKNPAKHPFRYTTNWGPVIRFPREKSWSVRAEPLGLRPEFRINGTKLWRPAPGKSDWPPETESFEVRNPGDQTVMDVVFGVGPEAP